MMILDQFWFVKRKYRVDKPLEIVIVFSWRNNIEIAKNKRSHTIKHKIKDNNATKRSQIRVGADY